MPYIRVLLCPLDNYTFMCYNTLKLTNMTDIWSVVMNNGFTDRYVENKQVDFQKIKDNCGVGGVKKVVEDNKNCRFLEKRQ